MSPPAEALIASWERSLRGRLLQAILVDDVLAEMRRQVHTKPLDHVVLGKFRRITGGDDNRLAAACDVGQ